MTVSQMRWIDRFVGIPLCYAAGAWARARSMVSPNRVPDRPPVIVVVKMFGLGSILLAFPFLAELRRRSPRARIAFVTFASNVALLERLPYPVDIVAIRTSSFTAFAADAVRAVRRLRRMRPRVVYDLEFFSKFSTLLSTLTGASRRYGFDLRARWRRLNLTDRVPYREHAHICETFFSHLDPGPRWAGTPSIALEKATEEEHRSLSGLLALHGLDRRRMVGVNINAGTTSLDRRWPPDRFAETLATYLHENPDTAAVLTGDATERPYVQDFLDAHPALEGRAFNFAGRCTLGEFLALIERTEWFLTNDSAPMHFAAVLGTPVIALFGPESPARYAPPGNVSILYAGLPCSPCLSVYRAKQYHCPYGAMCMRSIAPADVLRAIRGIESETHTRRERA